MQVTEVVEVATYAGQIKEHYIAVRCCFQENLFAHGPYVCHGLYADRAGHYVLLLTFRFFFFSARSLGRSSPNFATYSIVTQIYKTGSDICGPLSKKIAVPKHQNVVYFCDLIADISGTKQDIVKR